MAGSPPNNRGARNEIQIIFRRISLYIYIYISKCPCQNIYQRARLSSLIVEHSHAHFPEVRDMKEYNGQLWLVSLHGHEL